MRSSFDDPWPGLRTGHRYRYLSLPVTIAIVNVAHYHWPKDSPHMVCEPVHESSIVDRCFPLLPLLWLDHPFITFQSDVQITSPLEA